MSSASFEKNIFAGYTALAKKCGYDMTLFQNALHAGIKAMQENDGTHTNKTAFSTAFKSVYPKMNMAKMQRDFDKFYRNDFNDIKKGIKQNYDLRPVIKTLRKRHIKLVLTTNPVFPMVTAEMRLAWVNLTYQDFDYITAYDNSRHDKTKIGYYQHIIKHLGLKPDQILMIDNNMEEASVAMSLGIHVYIVTDYLVNPARIDVNKFHHSTALELFTKFATPDSILS